MTDAAMASAPSNAIITSTYLNLCAHFNLCCADLETGDCRCTVLCSAAALHCCALEPEQHLMCCLWQDKHPPYAMLSGQHLLAAGLQK
jgi:hypothetical protein